MICANLVYAAVCTTLNTQFELKNAQQLALNPNSSVSKSNNLQQRLLVLTASLAKVRNCDRSFTIWAYFSITIMLIMARLKVHKSFGTITSCVIPIYGA